MRKINIKNAAKAFFIPVACFLLVFLAGCDDIAQLLGIKKPISQPESGQYMVTGTIIAKVNNIPITLEELEREIGVYNDSTEPGDVKITTRTQKLEYLKNVMIPNVYLYQDALDRGLDKKGDIRRIIEQTRRAILIGALRDEEMARVSVTQQEARAQYETMKNQLKDPEERQVREIVVATEQEANDISAEALKGADFAALARQRSKAASSANGGDLGFIRPGEQNTSYMDKVVFQDLTSEGRISYPFKGLDGNYHIVKLEKIKPGKQYSFYDSVKLGDGRSVKVSDYLINAMKRDRYDKNMEQLLEKLSTQYKLVINEGAIK